MVPLESVLSKPQSAGVSGLRLPALKPPSPPPAEPPTPLEFKVMDVATRELLVEHADARTTVQALEAARSIVDVAIYVWEPTSARWRRLTFGEAKALWEYRGRTELAGP